ncbi:putative transporter MCH1 [Xylariomycetidae sp. FL2044]|nr:putative transporter MCH1 [Xylariomycetidae sp. FL2044]
MADNSTDRTLAPLLRSPSSSTLGSPSSRSSISHDSSIPKLRRKTQTFRAVAFVASIVAALCAGSITVFSLYGHLFQSRLHYSQFQINGIASAMSISMYTPVPIIGYMCDRIGPGPLSFFSAILTGGGYGLAAGLYQKGVTEVPADGRSNHTTFPAMVFAFVAIGVGTAALYIAAITTCAKNFGRGKYRGLMLVAPIASFGLSGMILSQVGSRIFYETELDGGRGDVNGFHFFLFLCILLATVGLIGSFTLRIIDEQDLIDGAVEELERSGLLEGSEVFRRRSERNYGTADQRAGDDDDTILDPLKDNEDDNARLKKAWLLNAETRRFLTDHTMWWFAIGFWLCIGPGEAFINNLGTVIGTLYTPSTSTNTTSAATHVSIMATVSTVARLVAASLSDLLSPSPHSQHIQTGAPYPLPLLQKKLSVSRITLFVISALLTSVGTLVLASGVVQEHAGRFWIVSGSIGAGYGAVFSLTPIIITMIWGVENFGTNFGIVALTPAVGSTMWGLIYSAVYQAGAASSPSPIEGDDDDDVFCYGKKCYSSTFWAMTVSVWLGSLMILWAWKGRDGWAKRGIVI